MGVAKKTRKFGLVSLFFPQHHHIPLLSLDSSSEYIISWLTPFFCPQVKRVIGQRDARLKKNQKRAEEEGKKPAKGEEVVRAV